MKWVRHLLLASFALSITLSAFSQSEEITLAPQQIVNIQYPDVTAVFARGPSVVRVSLGDDSIGVRGVAAGETEIVVFLGYHRIENIRVRCVAVTSPAVEQQSRTNQQHVTPDNATPPVLSGQPHKEELDSNPENMRATNPAPNSVDHGMGESLTNAIVAPMITLTEKPLSIRETGQMLLVVSQVSAAYSVDPLIAEAQIVDGELHIWAGRPAMPLSFWFTPIFRPARFK